MYGEVKVFTGTAHPELAIEICNYLKIPLSEADVFQFPNENIFVRLGSSVRGQDVFVIQPMSRPVNKNIMELLILLDTFKRDSAGRITAVFPYMAYARSDKKDQPRVPISARLIADMIETAGADRYLTVDLHAGQIQGFFRIPGDELTAFHIQRNYLLDKDLRDLVVVAPDAGRAKDARYLADALDAPLAIVEKRRVGNDPTARALQLIGEVRDRTAIVFDDEVDTAGTITSAIHFLKEVGAHDVYAVATHAILSPPAVERLSQAPLTELIVTNTVPIPPEKRLPNMTILSIAPLLGEVIRRIHFGISVGALFNE
ncbi:MAG: ribose-phosphate pyrophosphokinase [Ardenticatenaceae bacterium]|nr:ribose-phosphate pyrophosphokinase [Ardenticatenaceae bacterium]HBY93946.1 ribose-phosphate diphosphokinase [Chloroflexota bacterium]